MSKLIYQPKDIPQGGYVSTKINKLLLKDRKNYHIVTLNDITDENNFLNKTAEILKNGCDVLEFDGTNLSSSELFSVAKKLRNLSGVFNSLLIIKDRIDIAKLSGADGVCLDRNSIPASEAYKLTENHLLLGCHANDEIWENKTNTDNLDFIVSSIAINIDIKTFLPN